MTAPLARVTFEHPVSLGKFTLSNAPRNVYIEGRRCEARAITQNLTEYVTRARAGSFDVVEGRPPRRTVVYQPRTIQFPGLRLNGQEPPRWSWELVSAGELRSLYWARTVVGEDGSDLAAHLEWEVWAGGFAIGSLKIGNTLRSPDDRHGTHVTGRFVFTELALTFDAPMEVIWETPRPHQQGWYVFKPGDHLLDIRTPYECRFAVVPAGASTAMVERFLRFEHHGLVRGAHAPRFGPECAPVANLEDGHHLRHGSTTGRPAVVAKGEKDLQAVTDQFQREDFELQFLGEYYGAEGGGLDITPGLAAWQSAPFHAATTLRSYLYQNRMGEVINRDTLDPLYCDEVVEALGELPWLVKCTPFSEEQGRSLPWMRDMGDEWSKVPAKLADEREHQESFVDLDNSHVIRLAWQLKYRAYMLGSLMAAHSLRGLFAHFQFETNGVRDDGHSINRLLATGKQSPGEGDPSLGRRAAWPLHVFACAWDLSEGAWRRAHTEWCDRYLAALDLLVSPAGCSRRREAGDDWGSASPGPNLPDDSPELAAQVFEETYLFLALWSVWETTRKTLALDIASRIITSFNGGALLPWWGKFVTFGTRREDGTELYPQPHNVEGDSGANHQANVCALAGLVERGKGWFGDFKNDENYLAAILSSGSGWEGVQSHETLHLNWHLYLIGLLQARALGGSDA